MTTRRNPDGSGLGCPRWERLCLHIDLDCDRVVLVRITRDEKVTTTLSKRFTEWLAAEARQAA